jgi:hypothetical protein
MSLLRWTWLALLILLCPRPAWAETYRYFKIDRENIKSVQVGFNSFSRGSDYGFKAGLWTPIIVTFTEIEQGGIRLREAQDGSLSGEILVEVPDSDNVFNTYPQKFTFAPNQKTFQVVTYTKVAGTYASIKISVRSDGKTYNAFDGQASGAEVGSHLYLALNDSLPDLNEALIYLVNPNAKNDVNAPRETRPRYLTYENQVANLPAQWFGYEPVDLALMATANESFLDALLRERDNSPQLQALAQWIGRGGRLVISIAPANSEKVKRLLASAAWNPALPPVLAVNKKSLTYPLSALNSELRNWANAGNDPFKLGPEGKAQGPLGVRLQSLPTFSVECWDKDEQGPVPLIVRFPHGLGSITVMGFNVKDPFFASWSGRFLFWQQVVNKLAPLVNANAVNEGQAINRRGEWVGGGNDLTSRLYQQLDTFDTPSISFGWVVLFIFLYIVVVGPIDYVILKFVFKRLELTWITFPAVVITVSLLAYFTAYAIKGQDLKVNKIDLIDIDMRSALKADHAPAAARAYGTTWFSILSPRIQNYTIGLEPALYQWQEQDAPAQPIEPTMSWLGRPETGGMAASGRNRSTSLFSRTYSYEENATGLRDVPIPVWTTKSFTASWEASFTKLPLEVNLYYSEGRVTALGGTLKNNLPFDLQECALVYRRDVYILPNLAKGAVVPVLLDQLTHKAISQWAKVNEAPAEQGWDPDFDHYGAYDPTTVLRQLMFHEIADPNHGSNHAHRNLDLGWRLKDDMAKDSKNDDTLLREAILVCRLPRVIGLNEGLHASADPRLLTHLWLGELPGTPSGESRTITRPDGKTEIVPAFVPRPTLQGALIQDTNIRVLMPVTPKKL